jgi:hypothetical protein
MVVVDRQDDRPGDGRRIAADLGAEPIQQGRATDGVVDVVSGVVPQVGVLGGRLPGGRAGETRRYTGSTATPRFFRVTDRDLAIRRSRSSGLPCGEGDAPLRRGTPFAGREIQIT